MLTGAEIKQFIEEDAASERKRMAEKGQKYYEGRHDILDYKMYYYNADGVLVEDKARSNSKICHPFFTELVDQLAAYLLSSDENPIRTKKDDAALQEHLDVYFDDAFWAEMQELVTGANAKGFEYLYGYKNDDDRLTFECADSLGIIEIPAKYASDKEDHVLYTYTDRMERGGKTVKKIQDFTRHGITFYVEKEDAIVPDPDAEINPRPHIVWREGEAEGQYGDELGFLPFWRLDNNAKQHSGLNPIKGLIDDYDLMECGLSNNLQDFDTPVHLVKGYRGDDLDELQQNIKTKKIMGVDENGGVEILTVDVPYEARKTKADEDEKNIYRFGMGFNSAQVGDGNITNIVIRSRYTLLELKANKLEKRLKRFLKDIIRVVLDEINRKNSTSYQYTDVKIDLKRIVPTNEQETIQNAKTEAETEQLRINNILNTAMLIGDEEALRAICGILELDFEELKNQLGNLNESQNTREAFETLESVVVENE